MGLEDVEFGTVFAVDESGSPVPVDGVDVPSTYVDDAGELIVEGDYWVALAGYSGQHGYSGPVMHPSEYLGGRMADDMRDPEMFSPGTRFVVVGVEALDNDGEPAGWAVLYREPGAVPA